MSETTTPSAELERIAADHWDLVMRTQPTSATILGDLVVDVPQDVQINRQIVRIGPSQADAPLVSRLAAVGAAVNAQLLAEVQPNVAVGITSIAGRDR